MPNGDYLQEYREENAQLREQIERLKRAAGVELSEENDRLIDELTQLRAQSAAVVVALDRAMQMIGALIAWLPEGQQMSPELATCKAALDHAMRGLPPNAVPPVVPDETDRLKKALEIAGQNIISLTTQRQALTNALNQGLLLLEGALTELQRRGISPPPQIVVTKAKFDQAMRELLQPGGVIHDLRRRPS